MAEIIKLDIITSNDIEASEMLHTIADEDPDHAFVIAWPRDGKYPSYHSSTADMPTILMRLNEFIHKAYNGEFGDV